MTGGTTVAVDIGGTFTDVVVLQADGAMHSGKYLTSTDDPARSVLVGIEDVLRRARLTAAGVTRVVHATTLATNVILERRGVDIAFITTRGFGDMLMLGRAARVEADRFDVMFEPWESPLPRSRCFEVDERIGAHGSVLRSFDADQARQVVEQIAGLGVEAVAICFINAFANDAHEAAMAELCRARLDGLTVVASTEIWPEYREYERATTAVASAYVGPVMRSYLGQLSARLGTIGIDAPVHIMESSGGLMAVEHAAERAVFTIESGPAAGVIAAANLGRRLGRDDVISFDMGGTTAKAGVVRGGHPDVAREFFVGGTGSHGGRREGTGLPIKAPVIDLAEVGAGGGSIAWVDDAGALRVGPRSAGSSPGPACYGLGGSEPTVTDANLVLGYLGSEFSSGQALNLDVGAAREAIERRLAKALDVTVPEAAHAVFEIANASMASAVHVVTVQRGVDPRGFAFVALGGAGPVHAARIADRFDIGTVIVPYASGVGSAVGLLTADASTERAANALTPLSEADPERLNELFVELERQACAELDVTPGTAQVTRLADMRFQGQAHELSVVGPEGTLDRAWLDDLAQRFADEYARRAGSSSGGPTELVSIRVRVTQPVGGVEPRPASERSRERANRSRDVYFLERGGFVSTAVIDRAAVPPNESLAGPLVIEEAVSTTIVPPGWRVTAGELGELILTKDEGDTDGR